MDWWTGEKPDRRQTGQRKDFQLHKCNAVNYYICLCICTHTLRGLSKNVQTNDLLYVRLYWSLRLDKKMITKNIIIQIMWKLNTQAFLCRQKRNMNWVLQHFRVVEQLIVTVYLLCSCGVFFFWSFWPFIYLLQEENPLAYMNYIR